MRAEVGSNFFHVTRQSVREAFRLYFAPISYVRNFINRLRSVVLGNDHSRTILLLSAKIDSSEASMRETLEAKLSIQAKRLSDLDERYRPTESMLKAVLEKLTNLEALMAEQTSRGNDLQPSAAGYIASINHPGGATSWSETVIGSQPLSGFSERPTVRPTPGMPLIPYVSHLDALSREHNEVGSKDSRHLQLFRDALVTLNRYDFTLNYALPTELAKQVESEQAQPYLLLLWEAFAMLEPSASLDVLKYYAKNVQGLKK